MAKSSLYNQIYNIYQEKNKSITTSNIKYGVTAFDVIGEYTKGATAYSGDISDGKTAYVNGAMVTGGLREYTKTAWNIPFTFSLDNLNQQLVATYDVNNYVFNTYANGKVYGRKAGEGVLRDNSFATYSFNSLSSLIGLKPMDLRKDIRILDIVGQYDSSTEFAGIKMTPIVPNNNESTLTRYISEISGLDVTNGTNLQSLFTGLQGLISVTNLSAPNVTSMNMICRGDGNLTKFSDMNFYNDAKLTGVPMQYAFSECTNLQDITNVRFPLNINLGAYMFANCQKLPNLHSELNFITTNMTDTFFMCTALQNVSNAHFSSNVSNKMVNMYGLFDGCHSLDYSTIDFSNVWVTGGRLFANTSNASADTYEQVLSRAYKYTPGYASFSSTDITRPIQFENISSFTNTSTQFSMDSMYGSCPNLSNIDYTSSYYWGNIGSMFSNCVNLTNININFPNMNVTSAVAIYMFQGCNNLCNVNLSLGKIINTNAYYMFANCRNLITANLTNVAPRSMVNMFYGCNHLQHYDFISLNLNTNLYATGAFYGCNSLNNITNIDQLVSAVNGNAYGLFYNCHNLKYSKPLVFNGIYPVHIAHAFGNCYNLSVPIVGHHISNITGAFQYAGITSGDFDIDTTTPSQYYASDPLVGVFRGCPNLTTVNINWTDSNTNSSYGMSRSARTLFYDCPNLVSVAINININIAKTIYFNELFVNCPNLTTFNYKKTGTYKIGELSVVNCPSLSDSSLDTLLGMLATSTITSKVITNHIVNCCSNDKITSLSNYQNALKAGWVL